MELLPANGTKSLRASGRRYFISPQMRSLWCRIGLLVFAVIPLIVTLILSVIQASPWYDAWVRRRLVQHIEFATGLSAAAKELRYSAGGLKELRHLTLTDPETGHQVAYIRSFAIRSDQSKKMMTAHADDVEIQLEAYRRIVRRVQGAVLQPPPTHITKIVLIAKNVKWQSQIEPWSWPTVNIQWHRHNNQLNMLGTVTHSENDPQQTHTWRIVRKPDSNPSWQFQLDSRLHKIPTKLLRPWSATLDQLGEDASFQGYAEARWHDDKRQFYFSGDFNNIDLERALKEKLVHRLAGTANLHLDHLRSINRSIQSALGTIKCTDGAVERSLLESTQQWFHWRLNSLEQELPRNIPFQKLAFQFQITRGHCQLLGICDPSSHGQIVQSRQIEAAVDTSISLGTVMQTLLQESWNIPIHHSAARRLESTLSR